MATFNPSGDAKSGSTNLPEGVVHVYRETIQKPGQDGKTSISSTIGPARTTVMGADSDGVTIGVLAVPAWMTPSDFLAFVAPAQEGMIHLRMIRWAHKFSIASCLL